MIKSLKIIVFFFYTLILVKQTSLCENKPHSCETIGQHHDKITTCPWLQAKRSADDFDEFFKIFKSDRLFQIARIQFPLKVSSKIEEAQKSKYMAKEQWTYTNFDKIKNIQIKKISNNPLSVDIMLSIIDTGVQVVYHFKKQKGQWSLFEITDYSN